jgi:precorrin-2/cobalt-factor-2 C20-methyltransferase
MTGAATLFTVGVGPGDPELMTLKAARIIAAAPVVAYFAKRGAPGHARRIADAHVAANAEQLRFEYPYTTEMHVDDPRYLSALSEFYQHSAGRIAARLEAGLDVALLCEGDPFFYGSSMHLLDRLGGYRSEVVPGVSGMSGCWAQAGLPMTHGDDVLTVLPGTLDAAAMAGRLACCDAAVVMKVGRNLPKIRAALGGAGLAERAVYVERGTMADQRILRLADTDGARAPYFSMILVPGRQRQR